MREVFSDQICCSKCPSQWHTGQNIWDQGKYQTIRDEVLNIVEG